jgi:hypothetical protein
MTVSYISEALKMRDEIPDEIVIQIRAHQVRARYEENTRSTHAHTRQMIDLLRLVPTASELPCILVELQ